jgi:hypothetical protein
VEAARCCGSCTLLQNLQAAGEAAVDAASCCKLLLLLQAAHLQSPLQHL